MYQSRFKAKNKAIIKQNDQKPHDSIASLYCVPCYALARKGLNPAEVWQALARMIFSVSSVEYLWQLFVNPDRKSSVHPSQAVTTQMMYMQLTLPLQAKLDSTTYATLCWSAKPNTKSLTVTWHGKCIGMIEQQIDTEGMI